MIYGGVLERFPPASSGLLGEAGNRLDPLHPSGAWTREWRTVQDLSLTMPPSEYWKRQVWATYQTDPG